MRSWPAPTVPALPGRGAVPQVHDTASGRLVPATAGPELRLYVCGITPYDATHLGHAWTYLTYDTLVRAALDAGLRVRYVQNVTDVDDPLLERATATGQDWRVLAERETQLFRDDMTALRIVPPEQYVGAVEAIPQIVPAVADLLARGAAYLLDGDVYFSVAAAPALGAVAHLDGAAMLALAAERGGDPTRPGKKDPLDPLLWRAERPGEPSWPAPFGAGRPGWHIECAVIALTHLGGAGVDVQGGGADLAFPHHELSAAHAEVLTGQQPFAQAYLHTAMVSLDGAKMSKSLGNLVFVHRLLADGADPTAVRLALLANDHAAGWSWAGDLLDAAHTRLERWRQAAAQPATAPATPLLAAVRGHLAQGLQTRAAVAAVDAWAAATLAGDAVDVAGGGLVAATTDALLGVALTGQDGAA